MENSKKREKVFTWRRIHAFLLAVSMIICTFGFEFRAEASETGEQTAADVKVTVPQNVHEENGFIVWDEVEGAYGYTIQAGKDGETWEYRWYENEIEWNRFIYEHCSCDFGDYIFKVCAFDETGETTEFSLPVTVSYNATLSTPQNVNNASDGQSSTMHLTWDEVEGAVCYNIRIYRNDESHSLYTGTTSTYNGLNCSLWEDVGGEYEYLVTVQAMDGDYHVSKWTEEVLVKAVIAEHLATPQNVRFDESGQNIIWDEVEGADYYRVDIGGNTYYCEQPMLENWKQWISPWEAWYDGKQHVRVFAYSNNFERSDPSEDLVFEYTPLRDESIAVPQIKLEDDYVTWDKVKNAFNYSCRIIINGEVIYTESYLDEYLEHSGTFRIDRYPEGDHEIELCVIDEEGNYNSKIYPLTLDTARDESVWIPKLYHKFETLLWDYDRLRHPGTDIFGFALAGSGMILSSN